MATAQQSYSAAILRACEDHLTPRQRCTQRTNVPCRGARGRLSYTEVMVAELPRKSPHIRRAVAVWAAWAEWIIEVCPTENLGPGLCAGALFVKP